MSGCDGQAAIQQFIQTLISMFVSLGIWLVIAISRLVGLFRDSEGSGYRCDARLSVISCRSAAASIDSVV